MIREVRGVVRLNTEAIERLMICMGQGSIPPMTERMMQFFQYAHLPPELQNASKPFCELAEYIEKTFPMNPERTVCLRKLLEAKDAGVRALIYKG